MYRRGRDGAGREFCDIVLSRPLLETLPRQATISTLCHEMIHAWLDRVLGIREVHGPQFRARMAAINAAQAEFQVTVRHRYPLPADSLGPPRWIARCANCGISSPYRRRLRNLACRFCCERLHGGRWHASCLLQFELVQGELIKAELAQSELGQSELARDELLQGEAPDGLG
jgi:predicted SprT family Zn-dependent metalloprotease